MRNMIYRLLLSLIVIFACSGCSDDKRTDPGQGADKERSLDRTFVGNWRVFNDEGDFFYIAINPDRTAFSTWANGQKGQWKEVKDKVTIQWSDGWTDILYRDGETVKKISFEPGREVDENPTSTANAERVASIPTRQPSA